MWKYEGAAASGGGLSDHMSVQIYLVLTSSAFLESAVGSNAMSSVGRRDRLWEEKPTSPGS